ncbi:hypothetical protein C8R45DRAFT_13415 [Mycena sanguinolenta]|nr:hypothetical protein C8R45DRAFT_13415 [Mycena sanguinolenta]
MYFFVCCCDAIKFFLSRPPQPNENLEKLLGLSRRSAWCPGKVAFYASTLPHPFDPKFQALRGGVVKEKMVAQMIALNRHLPNESHILPHAVSLRSFSGLKFREFDLFGLYLKVKWSRPADSSHPNSFHSLNFALNCPSDVQSRLCSVDHCSRIPSAGGSTAHYSKVLHSSSTGRSPPPISTSFCRFWVHSENAPSNCLAPYKSSRIIRGHFHFVNFFRDISPLHPGLRSATTNFISSLLDIVGINLVPNQAPNRKSSGRSGPPRSCPTSLCTSGLFSSCPRPCFRTITLRVVAKLSPRRYFIQSCNSNGRPIQS